MMTWGEGIRSFANSRPADVGLNPTATVQRCPVARVRPSRGLEAGTPTN
jgi:hypothetical protein